jgi:flavodoxin
MRSGKMKIGMIIFSQTGNTYSVASRLYEKLLKLKKDVSIERIEVIRNSKQPNQPIEFTKTQTLANMTL